MINLFRNPVFYQKTRLSDMMHIVDGHLCKSKHFDAANFGLKTAENVESFDGNIGVKVSNVPGKSRRTDIKILPPQTKVSTGWLLFWF